MPSKVSRRNFLLTAGAVGLGFTGLATAVARGRSVNRAALLAEGFGPLRRDDRGILDLPKGFSYHQFSLTGQTMDDGLLVPGDHDGMAAYPGPDGTTILIRNHELHPQQYEKSPFGRGAKLIDKVDTGRFYDAGRDDPCLGGTTTLVYDTARRMLRKQFLSLAGTINNCAGGPTPWGTWLSCEETTLRADRNLTVDHGYVFEVPATSEPALAAPVPLKALGRFRHEAVSVDPASRVLYLTEDVEDGCLYRFLPNKPGVLREGGRLQALAVRGRRSLDTRNWKYFGNVRVGTRLPVTWIDLEEIDAPDNDLRHRAFADGAARFARGEGIWAGMGAHYFACTTGGYEQVGQIWRYTPSPHEGTAGEDEKPGILELFIEPNDAGLLDKADNVTVSPWGDLIVCEDGKDAQYLVGVTPRGKLYKFARNAYNSSEFAGATFSPDGTTLFVNVQHHGCTLAITGPWHMART